MLIDEIFSLLKGNLEIRQSGAQSHGYLERESEQYVRHAERVTLALLRRQQHNELFQRSAVRVYSPTPLPPPQWGGGHCLFVPHPFLESRPKSRVTLGRCFLRPETERLE